MKAIFSSSRRGVVVMLAVAALSLSALALMFWSCRGRGTDAGKGTQAQSAAPEASPGAVGLKPDMTPKTGVEAVVEGNNAFALDLYQRLGAEKGGENLFFSPFSISTALAMAYAGARGDTERQMARVLHLTLGPKELHPAFQSMMAQVNPSPDLQKEGRRLEQAGRERGENMSGYQLSIANALWGQSGHKWLPDFLGLLKAHYGAAPSAVDFIGDPDGARETINDWAGHETLGKIRDVLDPGDIDALTRLILTSAIYFKGQWNFMFEESQTKPMTFHLGGGKDVKTLFMDQEESHPYAVVEGAQVLGLGYRGGELSMILILPKKVDGLKALEESLTSENLRKWTQAMEGRRVRVLLPTFTAQSRFTMKDTLASMGTGDAFVDDRADFSGINGVADGKEKLILNSVIHKASVGVNEAGTEAAAMTASGLRLIGVHEPDKKLPLFRADHPFLFLIRHNRTGSILFLGRLMQPMTL